MNRTNPGFSETADKYVADVARALGVQFLILDASTPSDIDCAFATLAEQHIAALLVGADAFFGEQREQIIALAALLERARSFGALLVVWNNLLLEIDHERRQIHH